MDDEVAVVYGEALHESLVAQLLESACDLCAEGRDYSSIPVGDSVFSLSHARDMINIT